MFVCRSCGVGRGALSEEVPAVWTYPAPCVAQWHVSRNIPLTSSVATEEGSKSAIFLQGDGDGCGQRRLHFPDVYSLDVGVFRLAAWRLAARESPAAQRCGSRGAVWCSRGFLVRLLEEETRQRIVR